MPKEKDLQLLARHISKQPLATRYTQIFKILQDLNKLMNYVHDIKQNDPTDFA